MPDHSLTSSRIGPSPIPAQPSWFHPLPELLEVLRSMDATHLDRQAVEKLFGVGERRARQLQAGLPGIWAGNATAVLGGQRQWAGNGALRPKGPKRTCLLSTQ